MSKLIHRCVHRETAWSMFLSRTSKLERHKSDIDAAYSIQSKIELSDTFSKQVHARHMLCKISPLLSSA